MPSYSSYNIAEAPWWRVGNAESESVDSLEKSISRFHDTLNNEIKSSPQECEQITEFLYRKYVVECITCEYNVQMTYEDVEKYLAFEDDELQHLKKTDGKLYRTVIKIQNVYRTIKQVFPSAFSFESCPMQNFNLGFIQAIHHEIGKGIIDNCGQFRQTLAAPAQEDLYEYVKPELIQEELEKLVEESRLVFSKPQTSLRDAVKYGACFLYRFLDIHPFSNGNGRTARVLLSWLLQNFTIVPLRLYTTSERKKIYLDCLREARYDKANKPSHLARFILESIEKEFVDCCFMMEIPVI